MIAMNKGPWEGPGAVQLGSDSAMLLLDLVKILKDCFLFAQCILLHSAPCIISVCHL